MLRRLSLTVTVAILLLAGLAQGAAADPINAKNSFVFTAACDGQEVQFVVNGMGDFTPGHVVGSTAEFIPEAIDVTVQFTPTGGEPMSETDIRSKGNVRGDVTCTFDVTQEFPEGNLAPLWIGHRLLHAGLVAILGISQPSG